MRDFIDVFPINQNSHLIKKLSAYEMQYGANLLHKTNLHGLQHQSSTSANEKKAIFDSWKLSTLALIVNISIESVLFLFQKPNICEFVFIELTQLDHARKILMQKILFIYALLF